MRVNKTTSLALAAALSGSLALGGVGIATAVAADHNGHPAASAQAPVPESEKLLAQNQTLDNTAGLLDPVTDLIKAVLKADNGKLSPEAAAQHTKAIQKAVAAIEKQNARVQNTVARDQARKQLQDQEAQDQAVQDQAQDEVTRDQAARDQAAREQAQNPGDQNVAPESRVPQAELIAKATADVEAKVDALVKASQRGDVKQIKAAVKEALTASVNVTAAVMAEGDLPKANLPGLPGMTGVRTLPDVSAPTD